MKNKHQPTLRYHFKVFKIGNKRGIMLDMLGCQQQNDILTLINFFGAITPKLSFELEYKAYEIENATRSHALYTKPSMQHHKIVRS